MTDRYKHSVIEVASQVASYAKGSFECDEAKMVELWLWLERRLEAWDPTPASADSLQSYYDESVFELADNALHLYGSKYDWPVEDYQPYTSYAGNKEREKAGIVVHYYDGSKKVHLYSDLIATNGKMR